MNKGRGFQHGWWLMLITLGVMLATALPFSFAYSEDKQFAYMMFNEITLIIPLLVGFCFVNAEDCSGSIIDRIGIKGFSPKVLPFIILLLVAGQFFVNYATLPIQTILTILLGGREYDFANGVENLWQNILLMCVLAPIFEEILCRGILMDLFKRYGVAKMLIYSSFGFAVLHFDMQSLIPLFFIGILLGMIRITTDSIFAAMVAHSASNLFALLSITFEQFGVFAETVIVILGTVAFPFLVWYYFKKCSGCFKCRRELIQAEASPTGFSAALVIILFLFVISGFALAVSRFISGELFYDIRSLFIY
ncbi:MAG: CPBP family intramembrane metalloprotease [Eubacteriales bacterium]|nr:CPBP family intramembrane metalloprotease [Eubacteriales bacterium]